MNGWWIGIEIIVICIGVWRISRMIKVYKETDSTLPIEERIEAMVKSHIQNPVITALITRDLLMYYYFFTKTTEPQGDCYFTLHKKMGYGGLVFGFIFVLVLEGIGITYFLHHWSPIAAWIHLWLSAYLIVFLISDFKAIKRNPMQLTNGKLHLRLGLRMKVDILISNIETIQSGKFHFQEDKRKKEVRDATLLGFEDPDFEVVFKEPVPMKDGIGRIILTKKVYFSLDEKEKFLGLLQHSMHKNEVG